MSPTLGGRRRRNPLPAALRFARDDDFAGAAELVAARAKALTLLESHLDKRQRESLAKYGLFVVRGASGSHYLMSGEGRVQNFCVSARGYNGLYVSYVPEDNALAILLMIRANEYGFLREACPYPTLLSSSLPQKYYR